MESWFVTGKFTNCPLLEPQFMETNSSISPALVCNNCSATITTDKHCPACGYPNHGTDQEKSDFGAKVESSKHWLREAETKVEKAKLYIYILAGGLFLIGLYQGLVLDDFFSMIAEMVIAVVFLMLAQLANKNPFGALLAAGIIYGALQLLNAIVDPGTIFSGILWKIFIVIALVQGIRAGKEAQELMDELARFRGKK